MLDDPRLLFEAIRREPLAGLEPVPVARERRPAQRQANARLMLPDMDKLMDQQRAQVERLGGEIIAPQRACRVEPDVAVGGHHDIARLQDEIFRTSDAYRRDIDRGAENLRDDGALARRQFAVSVRHAPR